MCQSAYDSVDPRKDKEAKNMVNWDFRGRYMFGNNKVD
jgi:hypothetical protein